MANLDADGIDKLNHLDSLLQVSTSCLLLRPSSTPKAHFRYCGPHPFSQTLHFCVQMPRPSDMDALMQDEQRYQDADEDDDEEEH